MSEHEITANDDLTPEAALIEMVNSKIVAKEASARAKEIQAVLIEFLAEMGSEAIHADDDHMVYTGKIVRSSSMSVDPDALRELIGTKLWNRISTRMLDSAKLEDAVAKGLISEADLAKVTTEQPRAPYLRTSVKPKV